MSDKTIFFFSLLINSDFRSSLPQVPYCLCFAFFFSSLLFTSLHFPSLLFSLSPLPLPHPQSTLSFLSLSTPFLSFTSSTFSSSFSFSSIATSHAITSHLPHPHNRNEPPSSLSL